MHEHDALLLTLHSMRTCRAGSMKLSGVRLSVCLSHHSGATRRCGRFAAVGPGGQEISVDCYKAGAHQQLRAVSRCRLT